MAGPMRPVTCDRPVTSAMTTVLVAAQLHNYRKAIPARIVFRRGHRNGTHEEPTSGVSASLKATAVSGMSRRQSDEPRVRYDDHVPWMFAARIILPPNTFRLPVESTETSHHYDTLRACTPGDSASRPQTRIRRG